MMKKSLRFHWSLSNAGDTNRAAQIKNPLSTLSKSEAQLALCQQAEQCKIDSVLMAIGSGRPDPLLLSLMLGQKTKKLNFLLAMRPGLISPTYFVQQVNTLSHLIEGRVHINLVSGRSPQELRYYGDFLSHDERYQRAEEFLDICHAFWAVEEEEVDFQGKFYQIEKGKLALLFSAPEKSKPEIFVGGNSKLAAELAIKYADCLWRFPDGTEASNPQIKAVLEQGKAVGLVVSLITRPTQEDALVSAQKLISQFGDRTNKKMIKEFYQKTDSQGFQSVLSLSEPEKTDWLTPYLWTGAVPYLGSPAIALVGSYENIAKAILEYDAIGITQFLLMGWPDIEEMTHFYNGVYPLIKDKVAHPK
ncbi:LLM class flavin-dependent oxidoreductase [Spirulina sp. 06S082]|uniref:LLM class flavin-dependent oxidoreductase n=1 Tax=Spirulina sp. 06S082 TaxID=3110248 RepID=UPI002B20C499|nr:LLM class flavin-dependent oxidoreductase [Spirulina sp. 06S082]MEA5468850.1 LLM class flavin-dependent oxidoreductase [Spirulina sp. 06S082]